MASNEDERGCVTLTWEIKNFDILLLKEESNWCWTPFWKTEHTGKSVWRRLGVCLTGSKIYLFLASATECFHLDRCDASLITSCREVPLKTNCKNVDYWNYIIERDAAFGEKRQSTLPNDTLTLRFKMGEKTIKKHDFRIDTFLHNFRHLWNIEKFDPNDSYFKHIVEENCLFKASLLKKSETGTHKFIFGEVSSKDCDVSPLNCQLSVKTGSVSVIRESVADIYNYKIYDIDIRLTKTRLDLQLESIIAVHKGYRDSFKLPSAPRSKNVSEAVSGGLSDDFLLLYKDKLFSDATVNTEGKSFHVHRNILSARSPVFRAMFEKDEMSESREGVVDIEDVDSETMDRMLVYLYGDSLESVQQWEDASALYYAADKYDLKPLKHKCASVLKEGLTVNNACEALVLADRHSDDQLMKYIVDFVRKNKEVISSEKWDTLQNSNLLLAAKVLRKICVK